MVMFLLSFVKGSKSASGYGPGGSISASGFGPGGPNPLGHRSRKNVYLLKIEAKSFRDTGHCKDSESTGNLGLIAGF